MNENFKKYLQLKEELKDRKKALREKLLQNDEYNTLNEERKASSEVVRSFGKNMIIESPELSHLNNEIEQKKNELKIIKEAIINNVAISDKTTGEQLNLPFTI